MNGAGGAAGGTAGPMSVGALGRPGRVLVFAGGGRVLAIHTAGGTAFGSAVVVAILLGVSGSTGCSADAPGTGPSGAGVTVNGRVTAYRTGDVVAGAAMTFDSLAPRLRLSATTDARGVYSLAVPQVADFDVTVNGAAAGGLRVHGPGVPGDLFVDGGTCSARYGVVYDSRNLRPLAGATVAVGNRQVRSDGRGWYLLTGGECPETFQFGCTTFMSIAHPGFETATRVVGRGFQAVLRQDVMLARE